MVILLLVTNIVTFGVTNKVTIKQKDRVIIPRGEYEQLISSYKKNILRLWDWNPI